jgi:hypothetical protein
VEVAECIRSRVRWQRARDHLVHQHLCALIIQSRFRGFVQRRLWANRRLPVIHSLDSAAVVIQAAWRGALRRLAWRREYLHLCQVASIPRFAGYPGYLRARAMALQIFSPRYY